MAIFVWYSEATDEARLVQATDHDEAYRKVIAWRVQFEELKDAVAHFVENDQLMELGGPLEIEPFQGEIPEDGFSCEYAECEARGEHVCEKSRDGT